MKPSIKICIGFLLLAVCLTACDLLKEKNTLSASWRLVSPEDGGSQIDSALSMQFQYAYLRLYDNNEYSFINTHRSTFGKWQFNTADSVLTIYHFKDSTNLTFGISSLKNGWLQGNMVNQKPSAFLFKEDPYFEYKDIDLMSRQSNQWRIKPDHKESKEEIKARVIAHVNYMRQYFKMIDDDDRSSFVQDLMHSPVRFYSNGIALKTEDDMPIGWIRAFYDFEDAKAGAHLLGLSIQSINRYPKGTKTFTEGYYIALGEMKDYLEKLK